MLRAAVIGLILLASVPAVAHSAVSPTAIIAGAPGAAEQPAASGAAEDCHGGSNLLRKLVACSKLIKAARGSDAAMSRAFQNRGMVYFKLGEKERAIGDFDRAIQLAPQNAGLYYARGTAWQKVEDHERAVADLGRAIELDPDHAAAYANRGAAWEQLGEDERALADYDRALELDPENASALNNRGNVLARLGDRERAIENYDRAISIDPDHASAYHNRAGERCRAGLTGLAVADYLHAIRIGSRERGAMEAFLARQGFFEAEADGAALEDAVRRWGEESCTETRPAANGEVGLSAEAQR